MQAADAVVVAAVEDRAWTGLLHAFACAVPAVASDLPTARELDGAQLVPPREPAALAAALSALAADPALRAGLAARGRRAAVTDVEACGRALLGAVAAMRVLLVVGQFPEPSQRFIVSHFTGLLAHGVDAHVWCSVADPDAWESFPGLAELAAGRVHVHAPRERPARTARALLASATPPSAGRARAARVSRRRPAPSRRSTRRGGCSPVPTCSACIRTSCTSSSASTPPRSTWMGDVAGCPVVVSFRGYDVSYAGLDEPGFYDDVWEHADALHLLGEDLWQRALRRGCPPGEAAPADPAGGRHRPLHAGRAAGARQGRRSSSSPSRGCTGRRATSTGCRRCAGSSTPGSTSSTACSAPARTRRRCARASTTSVSPTTCGCSATGSPDDVLDELRSADVLLHPAVSEGFGNAVLEAQAVEVPVVCTDADGLAENVVDGVTGLRRAAARRGRAGGRARAPGGATGSAPADGPGRPPPRRRAVRAARADPGVRRPLRGDGAPAITAAPPAAAARAPGG